MSATAAVLHVRWDSESPRAPYADWSTAARVIQHAVDAATAGDIVLVTNGVYSLGGRAAQGTTLTNRVMIPAGVTVRSVNGPAVTVVEGRPAPGGGLGQEAVRGAHLADDAVLEGFTIRLGHTQVGDGPPELTSGGGVFGESRAVLRRCVIEHNAAMSGGGAHGGRLLFCRIAENSAQHGGGLYNGTLENGGLLNNEAADSGGGAGGDLRFVGPDRHDGSVLRNCVVSGNRAGKTGGGASGGVALYQCTVSGNEAGLRGGGLDETPRCFNGVVFLNRAPSGPEYSVGGNGTFTFSCSRPLPVGEGNLDLDPRLVSASHLAQDSPCLRAGAAAFAQGVDIDGSPWADPPSMGADEAAFAPNPDPPVPGIRLAASRVVAGQPLALTGTLEGPATGSHWDFGDGTSLSNRLYLPILSHAWSAPGTYALRFTAHPPEHPGGVVATASVEVVTGLVYADPASPSPTPPYDSWQTAARTLDDAIVAALPGARILAASGIYDQGGRLYAGEMTRVVVDKPVHLEGVLGADHTVVRGGPGTRGVVLADGATLTGFTVTQGEASVGGGVCCPWNGAGPWLESASVIARCILVDNRAGDSGGGVFRGHVLNCRLERNSARTGGGASDALLANSVLADNRAFTEGGGAAACVLSNCTVVGNQADLRAGGVLSCRLYNVIATFNAAPSQPNHADLVECRHSCTSPRADGEGNIDQDPALASVPHLATNSPCIGAGSSRYSTGVDLEGEEWSDPPCIGADQYRPENPPAGPISAEIETRHRIVVDGFPAGLQARIQGRVDRHVWDFGDGTRLTNRPYATHAWSQPGRHALLLTAFNASHPDGVTQALMMEVVEGAVLYVNAANPRAAFPYASWDTAATSIQDAIEACPPGRTIRVTNGVYQTGSRLVDGVEHRVVADRALCLESVHGPAWTIIRGGPGIRAVSLGPGAWINGFTIAHGAIRGDGPGLWCAEGAVATNCWIEGNQAVDWIGRGGGAFGGTLVACRLTDNQAGAGGGVHSAVLLDCVLSNNIAGGGTGRGGGAAESTLHRCLLAFNRATGLRDSWGGGADRSLLGDCLVHGNFAFFGGGVSFSTLVHSTVAHNTAQGPWWLASRGGGVHSCEIANAVVFLNDCPSDPATANHAFSSFSASCTRPLPLSAAGCIDADPRFADPAAFNYRLSAHSPCLDSAAVLPSHPKPDLDGVPRPLDGDGDGSAFPDMGAYEFLRPSSDSNHDGIPDGWTWNHGLDPTDPGIGLLDPDLDGVSTEAEWIADTDPQDAGSWFSIVARLEHDRPAVVFLSSPRRVYRLESRAASGTAPWLPVAGQTDIPGTGAALSLVDTRPPVAGYYRVQVRIPDPVTAPDG